MTEERGRGAEERGRGTRDGGHHTWYVHTYIHTYIPYYRIGPRAVEGHRHDTRRSENRTLTPAYAPSPADVGRASVALRC